MAFTAIANIFDPEVLRDQISAKFPDMLVLGETDLVIVDQDVDLPMPGQQVKMPFWKRINGFTALNQGVAMTPSAISADLEYALVQRAGLALEILDTAELVSKADPVAEVANQIARRAAEYLDASLVLKLANTPNKYDVSLDTATSANGTVNQNAFIKAMLTLGDNFGKLQAGGMIIMHSKVYADLLQTNVIQSNYASGMEVLKTGRIGTLLGLPIHISDLVTIGAQSGKNLYNTYIVGPGSLGLLYQRQVMVEFDRDVLLSADVIASNVHFATHLYGWDDLTNVRKSEDAKSIHVALMTSY